MEDRKGNNDWLLDNQIMTINELSKYLKVSIRTIQRNMNERNLPYCKRGRILRFYRKMIDDWLLEGD